MWTGNTDLSSFKLIKRTFLPLPIIFNGHSVNSIEWKHFEARKDSRWFLMLWEEAGELHKRKEKSFWKFSMIFAWSKRVNCGETVKYLVISTSLGSFINYVSGWGLFTGLLHNREATGRDGSRNHQKLTSFFRATQQLNSTSTQIAN